MAKKPIDDATCVGISHVTVVDAMVIIAYLAPRTVEFYENAQCVLPMDDIDGGDINFKLTVEHELTKGEVFSLIDRETEDFWTCQVVTSVDNDFRFTARVVPIPPLDNYGEDEERGYPFKVVSGLDIA